jgi:dihydrofolate reductase
VTRTVTLFMQTTIDGYVATADGGLWEAFPWPGEMQDFANAFYRSVDTAVYSRRTYETIVPWWRNVAHGTQPADIEVTDREVELATIIEHLDRFVFSRTLPQAGPDTVLRGDPVTEVARITARPGRGVVLHAGAGVVTPLLEHGLIDELLLFVTPAVLGTGTPLFTGLGREHRLDLHDVRVFDGSVVLHRYRPSTASSRT